jgi:16S rRNA (cytidine1402-2'-O)-methyltransferase
MTAAKGSLGKVGQPVIAPGTLWLVPNALDFGTEAGEISDAVPLGALRLAARLFHWVAEDARSTRAFLNRVGEVVPLAQPMQSLDIRELPRPAKGKQSAGSGASDITALLAPARLGHDIGLISEAGLPAVADPGNLLVAQAHREGIAVRIAPGASSLTLALACSGLNGQSFAFNGYLPVPPIERDRTIRELEALSRQRGQTQLVIETPYRNAALLQALIQTLQPNTRLAVACGVGLPQSWVKARPVSAWRKESTEMDNRMPAVFLWQA